jgi:tetratricopeptide (TPR) repeat protein
MMNLAQVYDRQGKYQEAESLFNEALDISRRVKGEEHPDTLIIMNNLSSAEELLTRVLDMRRSGLGEAHRSTLNAFTSLGLVQLLQRKFGDAERTLRASLDITRRPASSHGNDTAVKACSEQVWLLRRSTPRRNHCYWRGMTVWSGFARRCLRTSCTI